MIIRCWGARGSIPVSGPEYIKYGGDTTCLEIRTEGGEVIIVDAGTGIRKLGNRLLAEKRTRYHLIFTHAHWDHILGLPFFKPIYRKETSMRMFGCPFAQVSVKKMISRIMNHPNFPVDWADVPARISYQEFCDGSFTIDSVSIVPILTSHPDPGIGYKFVENGKGFVFLTDNELGYQHPGGLPYQDYRDFSSGVDLLWHDAEFTAEDYQTKKRWGHSVYTDALNLALEARVKKFGLFHHNPERTDSAVDALEENCRQIIGQSPIPLECFAVYEGMEISL